MQVVGSPKSRSIFDIIEEQMPTPVKFGWQTEGSQCEYSSEDLLLEGRLESYNERKSHFDQRRYVLTKKALLRYKARDAFHSC